MKFKHKLLAIALAAASFIGASSASAAIVGGVDFGPFTDHIETTTVSETFVNGNDQTALGYGVVNTVNGDNTYTTDGSSLYFIFDYTTQNYSATSVEMINGTVDIYKGTLGNLLLTSSATNLTNIAALSPWVRLDGHGNLGGAASSSAEILASGVFTGATLSFNGVGLLDVNTTDGFGLADVAAFLDANGLLDAIGGAVDIAFTTSANNAVLNASDVLSGATAGCGTGAAVAGAWCFAGSADLRGPLNVPEPGSLALLGVGLLALVGAGAGKRRKS